MVIIEKYYSIFARSLHTAVIKSVKILVRLTFYHNEDIKVELFVVFIFLWLCRHGEFVMDFPSVLDNGRNGQI